jgi:hypothetical protein
VHRDPVEPGGRRAGLRAEAPLARECGGERLGGQVGGELGVAGAASEESQQLLGVTAVEQLEVGRGAARH